MAVASCGCWEPAIAADAKGALYVVLSGEPVLVESEDGGRTWAGRAHPPIPGPLAAAVTTRGDGYVAVAPDDALYYIAFLGDRPVGMQVARSDDGGRTWATNVELSLASDPTLGVVAPWKSWIAFGADGVVHLVYNQRGGLVMYGRSLDRGATFEPFQAINVPGDRAISNFPASPALDADGRLYLAYFGDQSPNDDPLNPFLFKGHTLKLAISEDSGQTFRTVVVASALPPEYVGTWFPTLVALPDGTLLLAYIDDAGAVVAVASTDHGETWGEPVPWSEGPALNGAPWALLAGDEVVVLVGETDLVAAHAPASLAAQGPTARTVVQPEFGIVGDFVHAAALPDGRIAAPWIDSTSLRVTVLPLAEQG